LLNLCFIHATLTYTFVAKTEIVVQSWGQEQYLASVLHVAEKVEMTGRISIVKGGKYERELKWGIW